MTYVMTSALITVAVASMVHAQTAHAGCRITVKAQYKKEVKNQAGKRVDKITVDLVSSDVRAKPGWWKKMQNQCNPNQLAVSYGGSVSASCELDLGCGKRQFRIHSYFTDADGNEQGGEITYVPAQGEWKDLDTSTTVDVGELGNKF